MNAQWLCDAPQNGVACHQVKEFDDVLLWSVIGAACVIAISCAIFLVRFIRAGDQATLPQRKTVIATIGLWAIYVVLGVAAANLFDAHSKMAAWYEGFSGPILIGIIAQHTLDKSGLPLFGGDQSHG